MLPLSKLLSFREWRSLPRSAQTILALTVYTVSIILAITLLLNLLTLTSSAP